MTATTITAKTRHDVAPILTPAEEAVVRELHTFQYVDGNELDGLPIWEWSFTDDAAAAAQMTLKQIKGVLSSLTKKGVIENGNEAKKDERTTIVTALGAQLNAQLNTPAPLSHSHPTVDLPAQMQGPRVPTTYSPDADVEPGTVRMANGQTRGARRNGELVEVMTSQMTGWFVTKDAQVRKSFKPAV